MDCCVWCKNKELEANVVRLKADEIQLRNTLVRVRSMLAGSGYIGPAISIIDEDLKGD